MELFVLIALYYLSQSAGFEDLVKPILNKLQSSEHLLKFLNDLSNFSQTFCGASVPKGGGMYETNQKPTPNPTSQATQNEASPTSGFAGPFVEELLQSYFASRK